MPKTDALMSAKALRYFLQLTDTMNYTQAAQILGITQPALTQQIKKLEKAIGAPLFGQVGKKLYLTEAGKAMQIAAVKLLDTITAVVNNVQEFTQPDNGAVNIGVMDGIEPFMLYDFMEQFSEKYPNITIKITYVDRNTILQAVDQNSIDLAIMYLPEDKKHHLPLLPHQYKYEPIYTDQLMVLTHMPDVKPLETYPISQFLNQRWVTFPDHYYLSGVMDHLLGRKHQLTTKVQWPAVSQLLAAAMKDKSDTFISESSYLLHRDEIKGMVPVYIKRSRPLEMACVYRKGKAEIPRIGNLLKEWQIFLDNQALSSRLEETESISNTE
ncbi:LysR family transcriptional regulator [Lactobacillus corticis]|uniref:LysR family transcriptional regulator n=1 Tax=Lactobacillus corticis TaxID=2201249 RepID=A0A916VI73_9LACO|nr:LysR family transcriptional regulator [Lactobacillus corticis]GFZ27000.1 LysR family transcriptional regulator [Lactobacillus corticis]